MLEVSLGDYVLNGGEVAAFAMIEAITRLIPGFMGNAQSIVEESHADGLLEYPSYTRPASWRGLDVPEVLMSGHHGKIEAWRREQSLERTRERRPDLLSPDARPDCEPDCERHATRVWQNSPLVPAAPGPATGGPASARDDITTDRCREAEIADVLWRVRGVTHEKA